MEGRDKSNRLPRNQYRSGVCGNLRCAIPLVWLSLLVSVLVSGSLISNSVFLLYTAILVLEYENTQIMSYGEEEQETIM